VAATKQDVDRWVKEALRKDATHIISVCDTFDWSDYPVYVFPGQDLKEIMKLYDNVNMQKINEVIYMNRIVNVRDQPYEVFEMREDCAGNSIEVNSINEQFKIYLN